MIHSIRTIACLILAALLTLFAWVWIQVPHIGNRPGRHLSGTFDAAVGMIDLYLRDDHRGFERLLQVDPGLEGVGRNAARTVAIDRRFSLEQRVEATRLLAERSVIDERFTRRLMWVNREDEVESFCGLDAELDRCLGCGV